MPPADGAFVAPIGPHGAALASAPRRSPAAALRAMGTVTVSIGVVA